MGRKGSSEAHDNEPNGNETHLQQKTTTTSTMACRLQLLKNIKELRFVFCQSSPASSSARSFVEKNYKDLKTLNPKLPILIRECIRVEPQLWVRYDYGAEKGIHLDGSREVRILKALREFAGGVVRL